ncbi:MAG: hypothetical protein HYV07_23645, partial [Deltaproteobacteria bacterium]|nr:hypothetical protein [Deltaproteobacteria bacterium]
RPLPDFEGTIQVVYSADDGLLSSQAVASVFVEDENDAPRFVSTPPTSAAVGELYTYEVGTFDPDRNDSTTLSIDEAPAGMELDAQLVSFTPFEPGDFGVVVRAADTHGAFALQSYSLHVIQPNRPPQIVSIPGRVAAIGERYEYLVAISDPDADETFELALESGPSGMVLEGRLLSFTPARSQLGPHLVTIRVADRSGAEARQSFVLEVFDVPVLVAPPIDLTVATSVYEANKFQIEGPAPVQTGVAPGAVDPRRAVWLRGRAFLPDGSAAPGAQVSVVGSPELGSTRTRLDGFYDLLVNGGSLVTVRVERGGSFPVDRAIDTVLQETYSFPEVVLSSPSPGTALDLTLPGAKVALGPFVEDERGARRAAVLFPPGVAAYSAGAPIDELTVSITELSAGSAGPSALTAPLPPTTGYGFVAELIAAESNELVFSSPVHVYLENFLNIPAGKSVPSGSYDRGSARWVPGHDGRAITFLGVDALGRAELDTDGDGGSDQGLGVSNEERALLATLYPAPASLLRVPLRHRSTWAFGYGFAPPVTAEYPRRPAPSSPAGSGVIEQTIDLVSTTFHLVYESDRVVGFEAPRTLEIPVAGSLVPVGLLTISSDLDIAGRKLSRSLSPAGERVERLVWDGLDAFGRPLQGGQPARARVAYEYPSELYSADPAAFVDAFGQALGRGDFVVEISSPTTVSLVQEWRGALGGWDARSQGLGGWWLDVHHAYDPFTRTLYEGNGVTRRASELGLYSRTIAGTGEPGSSGDGGPAVEAQLRDPSSVVTAPDGTVYVAESAQVRRIDPDGTIHSVFDSAAQELLVNGNAEADPPLAGWTAVEGEWSAAAPYWRAVEGARYFFGEGTSLELRQDVDLIARAAAIDLGTEQLEFSALTNGADFLTTPVATIELTDELGS